MFKVSRSSENLAYVSGILEWKEILRQLPESLQELPVTKVWFVSTGNGSVRMYGNSLFKLLFFSESFKYFKS